MQRTEANLEDHGRSKEQIDRLQAKAGEINGNSPCALGNGGGATPPAGLLITRKSSVRFVSREWLASILSGSDVGESGPPSRYPPRSLERGFSHYNRLL